MRYKPRPEDTAYDIIPSGKTFYRTLLAAALVYTGCVQSTKEWTPGEQYQKLGGNVSIERRVEELGQRFGN